MPRPSSELGDRFVRYVRRLDNARRRVDALVIVGQISRHDAAEFYQGLFLSLYTSFENLIEDLFLGLVVEGRGYAPSRQGFANRASVKSHRVARDLIFGGQAYVAWLPYERTERLANAYFRNGVPFSLLDATDKDVMTRSRRIRDAMAHKSEHAMDEFRKQVVSHGRVPAAELTPAGYLQDVFRSAPRQTRFEDLSASLVNVARKLTG